MRKQSMVWGAVVALVVVLSGASTSQAQGLDFRPIDTEKLVVQPTDAASNIFSGTFKIIGRTVADTIEDNGFVRTINNLLGRRDRRATSQPNGLPLPTMYPSTRYRNSFTPAMPVYSTFGQSVPVRP
jgi:hypothetical protein